MDCEECEVEDCELRELFESKGESVCEAMNISKDRDEIEAFEEARERVYERTSYGTRPEPIPDKEYVICTWSNSSKSWSTSPWYGQDEEDWVELDANEILVPYPKETVDKFVEDLPDLPLYELSTEARLRGDG